MIRTVELRSAAAALVLFLCNMGAIDARAADAIANRELYWNYGDSQTLKKDDAAEAITLMQTYGIKRLHIWLNDNLLATACNEVFSYHGSSGYWHPATLRLFVSRLANAGVIPVFTLSPTVPSEAFIESLFGTDGPLTIAAENSLDVEFDVEGNWVETGKATPQHLKCIDPVQVKSATKVIVDRFRKLAPHSKIIVSTTAGYDARHQQLIALADVLSPQLYESHWALGADTLMKTLKAFRAKYPSKMIVPAVSIECSPKNLAAARCGEPIYSAGVQYVLQDLVGAGTSPPAFAIWARNELNTDCAVGGGVCSTFGDVLLRHGPDVVQTK